jgi:hypothetical protein
MNSASRSREAHPLENQSDERRGAASRLMRARLLHWRSSVPSQRFAVEFDRRTVGVAVRVPGGFMFFASSDRFEGLDGRLFPRARALERELRKVGRRRAEGGPQRLPAI